MFMRVNKWVSTLGELGSLSASPPRVGRYIQDQEELNLQRQSIEANRANQIAKELATSTTLKRLRLGKNKIGDVAAVALASALARNKSLTHLWLDNNGIGDAGMVH
jgi:Leucine-rich repeat (LRR) protein